MKNMQFCRYKMNGLFLALFCFAEILLFSGNQAYAQRSRRTPSTTTRKPGSLFKTKESIPTQTVTELEERNKELVKQILDLQYERDFYKRKISEWTESQRAVPETQPKEKAEPDAKAPPSPMYIPIPSGDYRRTAYDLPRELPADSLLNLVRLYLGRNNYDEALHECEKLIHATGCSDRHYLEYGGLMYKLENYPKALDILTNVSREDSLIAIAAFYKGRIYQKQNSRTIAEVEFQRSRVLGHHFDGYSVAQGYQFLIDQDLNSAEMAFRKALVNQSYILRAEIYAGLAEVSYLRGDHGQEIKYLQQSLVYDPLYLLNNFDLGLALYEAGEYQSALLFFKRIAKYSKVEDNLHLYLGQTYYYLCQWDAALTQFQGIDQQNFSEDSLLIIWLPKTYYIKSLLAKSEGNYYEATNYFRKAREINAEAGRWMQEALTDLAGIYEDSKNYNSAIDYYSQMLRLDPHDGQTLLRLGITYYQLGDLVAAREMLKRASKHPAVVDQAERWLQQIDFYSTN